MRSDDQMGSQRFVQHFPSGFSVHDGHVLHPTWVSKTLPSSRFPCTPRPTFHPLIFPHDESPFNPPMGVHWAKGVFKHTSMNQRRLGSAESAWKLCPPLCCSCTPSRQRTGDVDVVAVRLAKESLRTQRRRASTALAAMKPTENVCSGPRRGDSRGLWRTRLRGWYAGEDVLSSMVPQSLHGFMGPVGFGLMVFMTPWQASSNTARGRGVLRRVETQARASR